MSLKKIYLFLVFALVGTSIYAQNNAPTSKPTIIANLIRLVDIEDGGKVSAFLTAKRCIYVGKKRVNDKLYYMYKAPKRFSSYGIEIPDHAGKAVSSAFYTTLSIDEYTSVLDQLKNEDYQLHDNDGSNPNFLTYAKSDNLITISIANTTKKPYYMIAASKLAIY